MWLSTERFLPLLFIRLCSGEWRQVWRNVQLPSQPHSRPHHPHVQVQSSLSLTNQNWKTELYICKICTFTNWSVILLVSRPGLDQGNHTLMHRHTKTPPLVMYNWTTMLVAGYAGRLIVSEKRVMLHSVRMSDEGSYMVLDRDGKVQGRNCLNVRGEEHSWVSRLQSVELLLQVARNVSCPVTSECICFGCLFFLFAEHQTFLHLAHGENLKMKLYIDHSNTTIVYRPKSDNVDRIIVDRGLVVAPLDPQLEGRVIVEGSELIMKKVQVADMGVFKVTDLAGFDVAHIYIEVDGKINLQGKYKLLLCFDVIFFFSGSKNRKVLIVFLSLAPSVSL